jgi:hypothetical protein
MGHVSIGKDKPLPHGTTFNHEIVCAIDISQHVKTLHVVAIACSLSHLKQVRT